MTTKKEKTLKELFEARFEPVVAGSIVRKLEKSGIDTPEKLMKLTLNDILQIKGLGRTSATQVMMIACDIAGKK